MYLKQLKLSSIRNLKPLTLEFSPDFNWIYGKNGSGKTSLLETIYLLATGRSFRSRHAVDFIQHQEKACVASGMVLSRTLSRTTRLGVERHASDGLRLRMNEEPFDTLSEWVKVLPVQLINVDSYLLLSGPPKLRRQFLDWPMFHVEHSFFSLLQRYRRALKQRNAALRTPLKASQRNGVMEIELWNKELSEAGEGMTEMRKHFVSHFFPCFKEYLDVFLNVGDIKLEFQQGWNENLTLSDALGRSVERDFALGYTSVGPHRADFEFAFNGTSVETMLSRGQLKLFISALYLARSAFVANAIERAPVCLLDDLSSELDKEASTRLLNGLIMQNAQIFATGIEKSTVFEIISDSLGGEGEGGEIGENGLLHVSIHKSNIKMFHVEHGTIKDETESGMGV